MYPKPKGNQGGSAITCTFCHLCFLCSLYGLCLEEPSGIAGGTVSCRVALPRPSMTGWGAIDIWQLGAITFWEWKFLKPYLFYFWSILISLFFMTLGKHVKYSLKSEWVLYAWINELIRTSILECKSLSGKPRPLAQNSLVLSEIQLL